MGTRMSRRGFMRAAGGAATIPLASSIAESASEEFRSEKQAAASAGDRIVDVHVHFDEKNPNFIRDFLALAERISLTACLLTPYSRRVQVAEAAKQHPKQIVPFGFIDLDATDVLSQVKDFHELGYRGLGELEFVKKPYVDASYLPVYELANQYGWVLLFHTGIVLRRSVDQPEDVASHRMRAFHLEEIARRFP
jgi:hypothetical protein